MHILSGESSFLMLMCFLDYECCLSCTYYVKNHMLLYYSDFLFIDLLKHVGDGFLSVLLYYSGRHWNQIGTRGID